MFLKLLMVEFDVTLPYLLIFYLLLHILKSININFINQKSGINTLIVV